MSRDYRYTPIGMKAKQWFADLARGAALGTGILPGVSVGTVGIIVNVYDKLISSIDGLRKKFKESFLTLLPIALGCIVSAVLLLVFWKKVAYVRFPFIMISVLAGFVIGGLPLIWKEVKGTKFNIKDYLRVIAGFLVAACIGVFSFLCAAKVINLNLDFYAAFADPFANWWIYFVVLLVGFVAAVACLIPGISGSMVLFIFSLYNPVVTLFISDRDASGHIITGHASIIEDQSHIGAKIFLIIVLLLGIVVGFLAVSKAMRSLLTNHRRGTFTCVVGFVLGSLVSMFVNNDMYTVYNNPELNVVWQYIVGGIALIAAAIVTFFLVKRVNKPKDN